MMEKDNPKRVGCCTWHVSDPWTDDGHWRDCPAHAEARAAYNARFPALMAQAYGSGAASLAPGFAGSVLAALSVVGLHRIRDLKETDSDTVRRFFDSFDLL